MRYVIALGSNLGDRLEHLRLARAALLRLHEAASTQAEFAPVYVTKPVDCEDNSGDFYNSVAAIESSLEPHDLLSCLQAIETESGRADIDDRPRNAPRTLDLDILFADDRSIDDERLTVPHPRWHLRRFVLVPLAELMADTIAVGQTDSVAEILSYLPSNGEPAPIAVAAPDEWQPLPEA